MEDNMMVTLKIMSKKEMEYLYGNLEENMLVNLKNDY